MWVVPRGDLPLVPLNLLFTEDRRRDEGLFVYLEGEFL